MAMQPEYTDYPWGGPPSGYSAAEHPKRYITVHNTSNSASAQAEASYVRRRPDNISAHRFADKTDVIQVLRTELGANHVGSIEGNHFGISWEFVGTNAKTRAWWLLNIAWLKVAALMARDCKRWGIPPVLLSVEQMRDGHTRGFITHDLARQAWGGTTHTDPGAGFPMDHLLGLVAAELNGDDMTPAESQKLTDIHYALFTADAGTRPPTSVTGRVAELAARPPAPAATVDVVALATALHPVIEAAAEAAVRKVLGAVDGATPAS